MNPKTTEEELAAMIMKSVATAKAALRRALNIPEGCASVDIDLAVDHIVAASVLSVTLANLLSETK